MDSFVDGMDNIQVPSVGDWISIVVTAVISATQFYVQMPLGSKSPISTGM